MSNRMFATKSVEQLIQESEDHHHKLKKALGPWDLISIGIGCIIGTGIFVLTGKVAISNSGPGVIISFIICGLACIFAALCYAEFASLIPIAGSAYTFSYASMGEFVAWLIGWDLILEYGVATAAVSNGWSSHFINLLKLLHNQYHWTFVPLLPDRWALTPSEVLPGTGLHGFIDLPAIIIVLVMMWLLIRGIKESATVNNIIVAIKIFVSLFFIGVGVFFIHPAYWHPLVPHFVPMVHPAGTVTAHGFMAIKDLELYKFLLAPFGIHFREGFGGWSGIILGAAIIFFAYIGFDAVATTSEEAKNPSKDLPIGIIGSLVICTILYILMSAIFTGIVKCDGKLTLDSLGVDKGAPMVYAFKQVPNPWVSKYAALLIDVGALCGLTSVLLVCLLGQSRVIFAMARDGLLPPWVSKVHPKYMTPFVGTLICGLIIAAVGGLVPLGDIAEMANIGTLFAFILVSGGILVIRKYQPQRKAAFRTPFVPWVPILSIVSCLALMITLPVVTWIRFVVWLLLGLILYGFYGINNSTLRINSEKK